MNIRPLAEAYTQENSNLTEGPGIKAHWNLTELIGSTANAFDSATADVDGDGELEVIVSKNNRCEFYCLKQNGNILWQTPLLSPHRPGYYGGEVVDIDGDGCLEYVAVADSVWVFDAATGVGKWTVPDIGGEPDEAPWILGHVSSTSQWDVIIARASGDAFVVSVYDWKGTLVWSTAIGDATYGHTLAVKDVDGDGYDEVFVPCSKKTVAIDSDGQIMWMAPLTPATSKLTIDFLQAHGLPVSMALEQVTGWWYHSDFAQVVDLYGNGKYYVLHDYGGGVLDPTMIQVLDASTGKVVDAFDSAGHQQWLNAADLRADFEGCEIVYVTREKVVMRSSSLDVIWEQKLSGVHHMRVGDWDGDGVDDIIVSTIFRGLERFRNLDSNFVVYNAHGNIIYNMLYRYPQGGGNCAGVEMQSMQTHVHDYDGDGRADVPVCFSNHDVGKFGSSQDVHQYIMSVTGINYSYQFLAGGNSNETVFTDTMCMDNSLQLGYLVPDEEYTDTTNVVLLMHMNSGSGSVVIDSSANGNDGLLYGGEWTDQGRFGNAIRFDDANELVCVPFSDSLNTDCIMIEVWIKVSNRDTSQCLVTRSWAFELRITKDDYLSFCIYDPTATPRWKTPHIEAPFTGFDRFTHVVATYDGSFLRLIVDGKPVAVDSHVGAINPSNAELYVGNNSSGTAPAQGIIDELRISSTMQPWRFRTLGEWVSGVVFPVGSYTRYGSLEFEHTLNGGNVFYDVLGEDNNPLQGHVHIVSSPHDVDDVVGPIKVRAHLERGVEAYLSPRVDGIRITRRVYRHIYLPLVALSQGPAVMVTGRRGTAVRFR